MPLPLYQVDAFADAPFGGNPAAVCPLERWLDERLMQNIVLENNLSETAFFVPKGHDYHIRWFTPGTEVDLCGHATLAAAFVYFEFMDRDARQITFDSRSGPLSVHKTADGLMMDFPVWEYRKEDVPPILTDSLGKKPLATYSGHDWLAVYESESDVAALAPVMEKLKTFGKARGLIATAPGGGDIDFVSRFFGPRVGVPEDPVTGSAHCLLTPFWAKKLGKTRLKARQISRRGGTLLCELDSPRVKLTGRTQLYMKGEIYV